MEFDEQPAVSSGAVAAPAAFINEADVEKFDDLSVDEQLVHASWKARKQGLESIARSSAEDLNQKDIFMAHLSRLGKETNTAVQEQLFETASILVDHGALSDVQLKELSHSVLKLAVEKGITGRPRAALASTNLLSSLTANALHEEVSQALLASFAHKTPKNRQQSLAACATIVREFGLSHLPAKSILKAVSPLFNDANALVRKEAQNVFCQCYRYLGSGIKAFLGELRDVQAQEMMKTFEDLQVGQAPEKSIKGFVPATARQVATLHNSGGDADADMDEDAYAMLDESPVVSKLPKNFFHVSMDKTLKWQDRCAMVKEHLVPLLASKRLKMSDDYHELVKCLRELFLDPQAPLMLIAIQCLQSLCKGLRTSMGPYARCLLGPIFDKMKDKKTSVLEHMMQLLNTMLKCRCVTLDAMQDEMDLVSSSKVPNQRFALIQWVSTVIDAVDKSQCQRLTRATPMLLRLANDEKIEVREAALALVAKMAVVFGDKTMQPVLSSLDAKQLTKVLGASSTNGSNDVSVVGRMGTSSASHVSMLGESPSGQSPMKKVPRIEKPGPTGGMVKSLSASSLSNMQRRNASNLNSARSTPSSNAASYDGKRSAPTTPAAHVGGGPSDSDPVAMESSMPTKEDALAKLQAALCEDEAGRAALEQLGAKEWKARSDAVQRLATSLASWSGETCTALLEHLVVVLKATPVWKDSIFQVVNAVIALVSDVAQRATAISHRCAYVCVQAFTPRFTEPKSKGPARDLLSVVAEGATPKFVVKHVIGVVQQSKNPKLTQEVNEWLVVVLHEFEGVPIDAKGLIDYAKAFCFEQTQPAVKQSAVQLVVAMRQRVGAKLDALLSDINPHIKATIDAEIAKATTAGAALAKNEDTAVRCRQLKATAAAAPSTARGPGGASSLTEMPSARSVALAEDDLPRVDLSHQFSAATRDMSGGKEWKVRSAAIKRVEELMLSAHKLVASNGITELLKSLRSRFEETNKNIVVDALKAISLVLESVEPHGCRAGIKFILPAVFALLGDQKTNLREEAARVCAVGVRIVGLEQAIPMMIKPLASDALLTRQTVVEILDKQVAQSGDAEGAASSSHGAGQGIHDVPRPLVVSLVPSLLKLAMDRSADVRAVADRIVAVVLPVVGADAFAKPMMELKPAEQQQVRPMLERRLSQLAPQPSVATAEVHQPNHHHHHHTSSTALAGSSISASIPSLATLPRVQSSSGNNFPSSLAALGQPRSAAVPSSGRQPASAAAPASHVPPPHIRDEASLTPNEILVGLRSASSSTAFVMCTDFLKRFRKGEDCGTTDMMQSMVDRLQESTVKLDTDLALGLINCLSTMFGSPRAALRCDTATLVPLLRSIFCCLLSEQFSQCDTVIRSLNSMTLRMLEGCQVNEIFGALMALMAEYSTTYLESNSRLDHKYVQVVVKCLMRLETEQVAPDVVIISCHDYLLQHPPSAFKSRDDLSIRTIKTILQTVSRKHGRDLLMTADRLVGPQNLVSHFIRACLESKEKALRMRMEAESNVAATAADANANNNSLNHSQQCPGPNPAIAANEDPSHGARHADPFAQPPAVPAVASQPAATAASSAFVAPPFHHPASVSIAMPSSSASIARSTVVVNNNNDVPTLGNVVPNVHASMSQNPSAEDTKSIGLIFSKIRNHLTSQQGIEELYGYLKDTPSGDCPEFVLQFSRCSDAFRSFIKRRLEKTAAEDVNRPATFKLPDVVLQTP